MSHANTLSTHLILVRRITSHWYEPLSLPAYPLIDDLNPVSTHTTFYPPAVHANDEKPSRITALKSNTASLLPAPLLQRYKAQLSSVLNSKFGRIKRNLGCFFIVGTRNIFFGRVISGKQ